ncbi:Bug family tripartite tricarboxylate transporter substrate binding protein [Enterovirga rhinocerotis]|uniref:Tripartite-type tricarboxylate transporter receptor subunit TctC n=1 Tax=Enterovirga rhinocerotis TaxID=1339210 RepID=A0A4R7BMD9_9HYPH|nr:tripartite tricarboxylate transporter substrate binding protein [Enterovirga rhinocerotis]TDR85445.1 tripartite-type tricarboxylate transporter receptor subunit TctC [Enterovirga rhinocerotis]
MIDRRALLAAGFLPLVPVRSRADSWPARMIKVIVPYPPGGSTDISARLFAEHMSNTLGQRLIIDNRPGAGANLGLEQAAAAEPDGYTIGIATTAHAINATLFKKLNYDIRSSFVPVALLTESPLIVVVHPSVPAKTIDELIALAKSKPGELNYASTGIGGSPHLAAEHFAHRAGIKMRHVPYRGSAPGVADVVAGHVQLMFDTTQSVLQHVRDGRVRALGITSRERLGIAMDIPTLSESGMTDFEAISWNGILAPRGTPPAVVTRLNRAVVAALDVPQLKERFAQLGSFIRPSSPEEFGAYLGSEIDKWGEIVRLSGAKVE